MPDIRTTILRQEQADAYLDIADIVDAGGNRFVGVGTYEFANGRNTNNTWVDVFRYAPNGQITGQWRVIPSYKADGINLSHSGADLIVTFISHAAVSEKPRTIAVENAVIAGVFDHTPGLLLQEGGAGAFVGGGTPPGEIDVDYDEVEKRVRKALGLADASVNLKQEFSGSPTGSFRQALEDKAKDAVREERVMTEAMFAGGSGSHIVYDQLVNTSYTGALGAIRDSGAEGEPTE